MIVVSRAQWGAEPPRSTPIKMRLPVSKLWLHHSVTAVSGNPYTDTKLIQRIAFDRRFSDISYNYLVATDGTVLEGRGFSVGAHTAGSNSTSFGVCLIGNYETRVVTDAQVDSVRQLVAALIAQGALNPGLYPTGGHRQAPDANTACPGEYAIRRLMEMRAPWIGNPEPPTKVAAMYEPPIGPIAAVWQADDGNVIAAVSPEGDVYAWGCRWAGNTNGKPYWGNRRAAKIGPPEEAGKVYMITSTSGEKYNLPDGIDKL